MVRLTKQLVKALLGVYLRFPLAHEDIHGEFGAIERLNSCHTLTTLSCHSHRKRCFELHDFFVCHFVLYLC